MVESARPIGDQVWVVAGASGGIGLATALSAAEYGAKLVLSARSEDALRELVSEIRATGGEAAYVAGDAAERGVMERLAAMAVATFGRIDAWVNDPGIASVVRLAEATDEENRRLFETNFWGVVHGSFAAVPELGKTNGVLVNLGSEGTDALVRMRGMYAATKRAVGGFTDTLRSELLRDGIPVTVALVEPEATEEPLDPFDVAAAVVEAVTSERRRLEPSTMPRMSAAIARFTFALDDRVGARRVEAEPSDAPSLTARAFHSSTRARRGNGDGQVENA